MLSELIFRIVIERILKNLFIIITFTRLLIVNGFVTRKREFIFKVVAPFLLDPIQIGEVNSQTNGQENDEKNEIKSIKYPKVTFTSVWWRRGFFFVSTKQ